MSSVKDTMQVCRLSSLPTLHLHSLDRTISATGVSSHASLKAVFVSVGGEDKRKQSLMNNMKERKQKLLEVRDKR